MASSDDAGASGDPSRSGVLEISGPQRKSRHQKRARAVVIARRHLMTRFSRLALVAILSTAIASPSFASSPVRPRGATAVGLGKADVMLAASFVPSSRRGLETTTRPWSAPVGHRQPRVVDVPAAASQQTLD